MVKAGGRGHWAVTALVGVLIRGWWAFTAWVSRDGRPWAIHWTGTFMAVGLVATYACLWLVAIARAAGRRLMAFRAITITATACACILILEAPAFFGLMNYKALRIGMFESRRGTTSMFIEDRELSFRRPANAFWSGRPRGDLASTWDLPIRAPREQTFTTDSRGFRNRRDRSRAENGSRRRRPPFAAARSWHARAASGWCSSTFQ